eukprot:7644295-Alexandrium_andersonii.AAC.1
MDYGATFILGSNIGIIDGFRLCMDTITVMIITKWTMHFLGAVVELMCWIIYMVSMLGMLVLNIIGIARCLCVLVVGGLVLGVIAMNRGKKTEYLYKKKNKKVIMMREYAYELRGML